MMSPILKGTLAMTVSCLMFGLLFLYVHWLTPLSGTEVFAWRMPSMWVGLLLLMCLGRSWGAALEFARELWRKPKQLGLFLLTTPMFALQMWLFVWAPANGYGLDASLGYFLLPLCLVLVGCLFFGERLSTWQAIAAFFAALGIVVELWRHFSFSWVVLTVCVGYTLFFALRRLLHVPPLAGFFFDITLIAPFALSYLRHAEHTSLVAHTPLFWWLIAGLGALSSIALLLSFIAVQQLPLSLYGMISNLEPILLFLGAILFLGERPAPGSMPTYILIWLSLLVLCLEGFLQWRVKRAAI